MKIKPAKELLYIEFEKEEKEIKLESGLIIPKDPKEYIATITLAGENAAGYKAGDRVILNPQTNFIEFRIEDKWYRMIPAHYVIGTIEE